MRRAGRLSAFLLPALVWAAPAHSQVRPGSVELGVYGGYWEGDGILKDAPIIGGRIMYNLSRIFGLEVSYGFVPTEAERFEDVPTAGGLTRQAVTEDQNVHETSLNLVVHLSDTVITPYISVGADMVNAEETSFGPNVALGAKYYMTEDLSLRADVRAYFSEDDQFGNSFFHSEATLGLGYQLGGDYDIDNDGIKNVDDQCKTKPEDKDGFEDSDGCPEPDNDQDGIKDVDDKCPNEKEDADGDADEDGCPDLDKDGDGVDDKVDQCVDTPEDKDGFEDEDGCPEDDNDKDGIKDAEDKCPNEAEDKDGFEDTDGCPDTDNDKDSILDTADKCPDGAEDKDGFQDEDGCPDPDNDHDGVLDADDKCPAEKEVINGFEDEDGCPDKGASKVKITREGIEILEQVYFENGKAVIKTKSLVLLNQVALTLNAADYVKKVEVQGHTDDRGKDAANMELSQKRAEAVRDYLTSRGIAGDRLIAKGYGETQPIASNKTRKGRATNRRVAFVILEQKLVEEVEVPAESGKPAEEAPKKEEK
ncbi:MAG: OmpA family protein [Bradymonadia bacterium]